MCFVVVSLPPKQDMMTMKQRIKIFNVCLLAFLMLFSCASLSAQNSPDLDAANREMDARISTLTLHDYKQVKPFFDDAYRTFPTLPRGVLEAVAFTYTRFYENQNDTIENDVNAIPLTYSVMGLTLHGKGVFRENLRLVSSLSKIPVAEILHDNHAAILAYAAAFYAKQVEYNCFGDDLKNYNQIFMDLSELPYNPDDSENSMSNYPMWSSLYSIYSFLADSSSSAFGIPPRTLDFVAIFGPCLPFLQSPNLSVPRTPSSMLEDGADYSQAIWNPAASCNYSVGRGGMSPTCITIHYTSGTYAGAIAWFQNCESQVSAHYVIRSFDGQVTQMVREQDKAWHVGDENYYTIGIEHEAYGNVASFFTTAMYQSSADLVRDICRRHPNISPHAMFYRDTLDDGTALNTGLHSFGGYTACTQIRGHQHYPNQTHTDPGPYWNWNYYYKLVNNTPNVVTSSWLSGTYTDSGGMDAIYENDERKLFHIHIPDVDSIELIFTEFSLERDYDFMWIYQGPSVFSPLVGRWNTQSPGRLVIPGGDVLIEFRSDCNVGAAGWVAYWQGIESPPVYVDTIAPTTSIRVDDGWKSEDFMASFQDADDVAVRERFYQVMENDGNTWSANCQNGFLCDNFDVELNDSVWRHDGHWQVSGQALCQPDATTNSFVSAKLNGSCANAFLFDFYATITSGNEFSFFFDCNVPVDSITVLTGYELCFSKSGHSLSLKKWQNGLCSLVKKVTNVYYTLNQPYLYRVAWFRNENEVSVFRHSSLLMSAQDSVIIPSEAARYVGWKTDNTALKLDNVRSYVSRGAQQWLTVGSSDTCKIRAQAIGGTSTCKLKSIVCDDAGHFSTLAEKQLLVDYTPPAPPTNVDDTHSFRAATMLLGWNVVASWPNAVDTQSGIQSYQYCICKENDEAAAVRWNWQDVGAATSCSEVIPASQNTHVRVGVRAVNNAGLYSLPIFSDGVDVNYVAENYVRTRTKWTLYPNPASDYITVSLDPESIPNDDNECTFDASKSILCEFYDINGRLQGCVTGNCGHVIPVSSIPRGVYLLVVSQKGFVIMKEKVLLR